MKSSSEVCTLCIGRSAFSTSKSRDLIYENLQDVKSELSGSFGILIVC